jgi:trehalose-phosphatase
MPPQYLFDRDARIWNSILGKLTASRQLLVFLDYDGTLVPIQKLPSLAVCPTETKDFLRRLSKRPNVSVGLVTGRSLSDIKRMVHLNTVFYVANHGFHSSLGKSRWVHPKAQRALPVLGKIFSELRGALSSIPGVLIEDKQYTLTVHYRNVRERSVPLLKRAAGRIVRPYRPTVKMTTGKKVLEVRPNVSWGKGHAVLRVLKLLASRGTPLIVYIGDDKTDEDAFRLLRRSAITIRVGWSRSSRAACFVHGPTEVQVVLKAIDSIRDEGNRR